MYGTLYSLSDASDTLYPIYKTLHLVEDPVELTKDLNTIDI